MKRLLLLPAAAFLAALALSACQGGGGDTEAYRRNHDNYMKTYEPKTGGPDL